MKNSRIAWTHHTFNPWQGCTKVSTGCAHCYAETLDKRWGKSNWGTIGTRTRTSAAYWKQPLKWNREAEAKQTRYRVFCASMADVCEDREDLIQARRDLGVLIEQTPWLDWLLLTKRPENFLHLFDRWGNNWHHRPDNIWVGTSAEDQAQADKRIPELLKVPARIHFLSAEPLLEPIYLNLLPCSSCPGQPAHMSAFGGEGLDWVIAGGESGANARPMDLSWARSLRNECANNGAAFFMKQLGGRSDKRDDMDLFPEDLRIQQVPEGVIV